MRGDDGMSKNIRRAAGKLAPMIVLGLLFMMWPSKHAAGGSGEMVFANYPLLWLTISIAFSTVEAVKFLLVRAKLLRTDVEIQVAEIYENSDDAAHRLKDLHDWHSPRATPTGTVFPWKVRGDDIEELKQQSAEILALLRSRR